jgi:hypothetical protein
MHTPISAMSTECAPGMTDVAREHLITRLADVLPNAQRKETLVCGDAIEGGHACYRACFLMTDEGWDSEARRPTADAKLAEQLARLQERRTVKTYEVRCDPYFGNLMLVLLAYLK